MMRQLDDATVQARGIVGRSLRRGRLNNACHARGDEDCMLLLICDKLFREISASIVAVASRLDSVGKIITDVHEWPGWGAGRGGFGGLLQPRIHVTRSSRLLE